MKKSRYESAIEWIAFNDEPLLMTVDQIECLMTVNLVADVFGKDSHAIAFEVQKIRFDSGHPSNRAKRIRERIEQEFTSETVTPKNIERLLDKLKK